MTSRILSLAGSFTPSDTSSLGLAIRLVALTVAVLCVVFTWVVGKQTRYFLEGNRIIIQKAGLSGVTSEEVITPQHTSRLRLVRSSLGSMFEYGSIMIEIESFSQKSVYELKNIEQPEKTLAELKDRLKS